MQPFQETVQKYYLRHGRHDLPWRKLESDGTIDPYRVLVSEFMLQQTQVPRVIPKFWQFMERFPDISTLAKVSLADVLRAWNGLGYNRRAKFLWQAAGMIVRDHAGIVPDNCDELTRLPGIGPNTAGAILAYAYDQPVVFIETNIRTVFIHHFFPKQQRVSDQQIVDQLAQTIPDSPRFWFWALMDYGTYLKQQVGNLSARSKHYTKQSAFEGSKRQLRGQVLRLLLNGQLDRQVLAKSIGDTRLAAVLADLSRDGLIVQAGRYYRLASS